MKTIINLIGLTPIIEWMGKAHSVKGQPSSTRLHSTYGLIIVLTPFMAVWSVASLRATPISLAIIPDSVAIAFGSYIALFLGAKAISKSQEIKKPESKSETPQPPKS